MAIVHLATISPTKQELVTDWLDAQPWGGAGDVEMIGSYRFDDPAGEVGVESLVVGRGGAVFQLPLTYRGAPLAGSEDALVTTMEHSALGRRWIHLATADPVGVACYVRSLLGQQEQAVMDVWDGDELVGTRGTGVTLERSPGGGVGADASGVPAAVTDTAEGRLTIPHVLDDAREVSGRHLLLGSWSAGRAVVAAL
jgi:hypothetical protein